MPELSSPQGFYILCVLFVPMDSTSLINIPFRTTTPPFLVAPADFLRSAECSFRKRKGGNPSTNGSEERWWSKEENYKQDIFLKDKTQGQDSMI